MKNILLTGFILFILQRSNAQLNLPFPDSNGAWIMTEGFYGNHQDPDFYNSYKLFVNGDTIIGSFNYKRLCVSSNILLSDTNYSAIIGYYRIDSLKVYYLGNQNYFDGLMNPYNTMIFGTNNEILLYDFGLQVGDSITIQTTFSNGAAVVVNIDSVIFNNNYYKRIQLYGGSQWCAFPYYWIEGIGSTFGFFPYYYCFENGIFFHCFHEDAQDYIFFLLPNDNCQNLTMGEDKIINKQLNFYPNPTNGISYLYNSKPVNLVGQLFSIDGEMIRTFSVNQGLNKINLKDLSDGFYIIRIDGKSLKICVMINN